MRTYALYGIDLYLKARLITLVRAENIVLAADKLGGTASEPATGRSNPGRMLYFNEYAQSAIFTPGEGTPKILVNAKIGQTWAYNVDNPWNLLTYYTALQIGEIPIVE